MAIIDDVKAKMAKDDCEKELWAGWNTIVTEIHEKIKKQKPLPKVYEVHHMNEVARKCYLTAFLANKGLDIALSEALQSIGIEK